LGLAFKITPDSKAPAKALEPIAVFVLDCIFVCADVTELTRISPFPYQRNFMHFPLYYIKNIPVSKIAFSKAFVKISKYPVLSYSIPFVGLSLLTDWVILDVSNFCSLNPFGLMPSTIFLLSIFGVLLY
jgi:hypothetical protein